MSLTRDTNPFPIMNDPYLRGIPWAMIAPFEAQAQANHQQSLRGLASRCGLDVTEACAILERRPWSSMDADEARVRLVTMIKQKAWEPAP